MSVQDDFPDDEINLYDLWNALADRWYIITGITLLFLGLGIAYIIVPEPTFNYSTEIEIGREGENANLIETERQTRARLNQAIIPSVRARFAQRMDSVPKVEIAGTPGGDENQTPFIVLSSEATTQKQSTIQELHQEIVERLKNRHEELIQNDLNRLTIRKEALKDELEHLQDERVIADRKEAHEQAIEDARSEIRSLEQDREEKRAQLKGEIANQERRLEALTDQIDLTKSEIEQTKERRDFLQSQIEETSKTLASLRTAQGGLTEKTSGNPDLALFLNTTNIDQIQNRLDDLHEEVNFKLPQQRNTLRNELNEHQRNKSEIKDELSQLRLELENLQARFAERIDNQKRTIKESKTKLDMIEANLDQEKRDKNQTISEVETEINDFSASDASFIALRSAESTRPNMIPTLGLSLILGGITGIFFALLAQFISNARTHQRASNNTSLKSNTAI